MNDVVALRLGFVPGVVPFKWVSRFRNQFSDSALVTSRLGPDDGVTGMLSEGELDAALMPLPVDKDVFHAIPLYVESDDQKGRVPGREIGLVWLKSLEHPLIEPLTGIVRGRTANSSRGGGVSDNMPDAEAKPVKKPAPARQPNPKKCIPKNQAQKKPSTPGKSQKGKAVSRRRPRP